MNATGTPISDRRPLAARQTRWAQGLARLLARSRATPNGISLAGVAFAGLGGLAFAFAAERPGLWLAGAVLVQFRLICNLLDGMVAVEGGKGGPTGALFNEIPDRFEDSFLLIGFGYGAGLPEAGYAAALLAVLTAYLHALGASHGLGQDFRGPMAKPQRMAALTIGGIIAFGEVLLAGTFWSPVGILGVIIIGAMWTAWRRISRLAAGLRARASAASLLMADQSS